MWNNNYDKSDRFYMESKTENGFIVVTIQHYPFPAIPVEAKIPKIKYETLVFPSKRNGEPDIDRCIKCYISYSEEFAMLKHMTAWMKFNEEGKDD